MARLSKKRQLAKERIDPARAYPVGEAVQLLAELSTAKFKESFEVAVNLGVDPRKSDQAVRGSTSLPHGNGKTKRVAVFAQGASAEKARAAGADLVGMEDLAQQVRDGKIEFDVAISAPDAMHLVGQLGRVLGPRGLMPNPKTGTVTPDVETAVRNEKSGQMHYKADSGGIVHGSVGQVGFGAEAVQQNIEALLNDLKRIKPASAKGVYLRKITLSTTMGPGLTIDQASLQV